MVNAPVRRIMNTEDMIKELYTVMLGVPDTDDRGMAGDCREIKKQLKELNGSVKTNTTWRKAFCWALGLMATGFGIFAGMVL